MPSAAPENGGKIKRLEWVAWNPVEHILYWEVSEGHYDVHGQYEPERHLDRYSIDPARAVMKHGGDGRSFMPEEGERLHERLDALAHYTMSSTLWWDGDNGKSVMGPTQVVSGAPNLGAGKFNYPTLSPFVALPIWRVPEPRIRMITNEFMSICSKLLNL